MGKAPLPHNKRNCYPPYPDHYVTTSDLRKTGCGHPCFQLSEEEMEVLRGVLFAIETREKTEFNFFTQTIVMHLV